MDSILLEDLIAYNFVWHGYVTGVKSEGEGDLLPAAYGGGDYGSGGGYGGGDDGYHPHNQNHLQLQQSTATHACFAYGPAGPTRQVTHTSRQPAGGDRRPGAPDKAPDVKQEPADSEYTCKSISKCKSRGKVL